MSNHLTFQEENGYRVFYFESLRRTPYALYDLPCATYTTNLNYLDLSTAEVLPVQIVIRQGRGAKVTRFLINNKLSYINFDRIHYSTARLAINGTNFIFVADVISTVLKHARLRATTNYENAIKSATSAKAISDKLAILCEIHPEHLI